MSVTVIIPTRNRPELLQRAVASIPADHDIVVVDDCSETAAVVADPRVRVIRRDQPGGAAAARNTGLAEVQSEWVGFCDDDDEWLPGRSVPENAQIVVYGSENSPRHRRFDGNTVLDGYTPSCNAVLVKTSLCPRFDEAYRAVEDVEWWLRLAQVAPVSFVDQPGYRCGVHDGSRHGAGQDARIRYSLLLLEQYDAWFAVHSAARGFRLARVGRMTARQDGRRQALRHLAAALTASPSLPTIKAAAAALRRA